MTKHTQGPLEAIGNLVRSPMTQQDERPRGVLIAECRDGYYLEHTDEAKANARLFAAAPELLEAAQEMADLLDNLLRIGAINPNLIVAESIRNVLPIHRAAIAKATQS